MSYSYIKSRLFNRVNAVSTTVSTPVSPTLTLKVIISNVSQKQSKAFHLIHTYFEMTTLYIGSPERVSALIIMCPFPTFAIW